MNLPFLALQIGLGLVFVGIGWYLGYEWPLVTPTYLALVAVYFLAASVVTLDIRLEQARRFEGQDFGELPKWTVVFLYLQWATFAVLAVLNWKLAVFLFVIKFILKLLPVLETVGNLLMAPFKPKGKTDSRYNL